MALFKCPECRARISSEATACPKCGAPVIAPKPSARPRGCLRLIGYGFAVMVLMGLGRGLFDLYSGGVPAGATPEPLPDLATATRAEWPALVTLRQPVAFSFPKKQDASSEIEAPVGTVVKLIALSPDAVTLEFKGARTVAKPRVCDAAMLIREARKTRQTAGENERLATKAKTEKAEAERKTAADAEKKKLEAELGPEPALAGWEQEKPPIEVQLYLKQTLRDPDSLQFVMAWPATVETYGGRRCWAVTFRYRAKNGFSGYNVQDATAYFLKEKFLGIKQR